MQIVRAPFAYRPISNSREPSELRPGRTNDRMALAGLLKMPERYDRIVCSGKLPRRKRSCTLDFFSVGTCSRVSPTRISTWALATRETRYPPTVGNQCGYGAVCINGRANFAPRGAHRGAMGCQDRQRVPCHAAKISSRG